MVLFEIKSEIGRGSRQEVAIENGFDRSEAALGVARREPGSLLAIDNRDLVPQQLGVAEEEAEAPGEEPAPFGEVGVRGVFDETEPGLPENHLGNAVAGGKEAKLPNPGDGAGSGGVVRRTDLRQFVEAEGAQLRANARSGGSEYLPAGESTLRIPTGRALAEALQHCLGERIHPRVHLLDKAIEVPHI